MRDVDKRSPIDAPTLEGLLGQVGHGGRAMIAQATRALVTRFGDRGSCLLIADRARVVLSTEVPSMIDFSVDLARYPEIRVALASRDVVAIEDVRQSPILEPIVNLLPNRLGAVVVVPLVVGARCLGVMMAQSERPREMSPADVAAARLEGRLVATLLDLQFGNALDDELNPLPTPSGAALTLPARAPCNADSPLASTAGIKRRILVAEDDPDQGALLDALLTREGFEVVLTSNGEELLRRAYGVPPDLILLDGQMPLLNGFDAAERLHADARTSNVPVLFLSGAKDLLVRIRSLKPDTLDFLRKPYSAPELLARIERSFNRIEARDELRAQAEVDVLTGLGNARALDRSLTVEQSRISRYGATSAIVMMDLDKLKTINDHHGHVVGSRVIQAIGQLLRITIRETDLAARYGGDEFVVILAHTTAAEGGAFAERFLDRVRELRPEGLDVSMSAGVACLGASEERGDALLAEADAAAYRAKRLGGNRACVFDRTLDLVRPAVES
jgi:diguanylate cyclase (GGDEF)-like protein